MKTYIFTNKYGALEDCYRQENVNAVLARVAATTDTTDLVVAIYLFDNSSVWRGHEISKWLGQADFHQYAGRSLAFIRDFDVPKDLPEKFKLIRMAFGLSRRYCKSRVLMYGWRLRFDSFEDHVAYLFAHELHHFRRFHLRLHHREGEQSACKWAMERVKEEGFVVDAVRERNRKRKKAKRKTIRILSRSNPKLLRRVKVSVSYLCPEDLLELERWIYTRRAKLSRQNKQIKMEEHYEKLRSLPEGAIVKIISDKNSSSPYIDQTAIKIGTLKRNSYRLAVRTPDGVEWDWPMGWLDIVE